jgi:hypothetical protein
MRSKLAKLADPALSTEIMYIVIAANAIKILCFSLALRTTSFRPLVTLGDALASFMTRPDPHTKDIGPLSAAQIRKATRRASLRRQIRCRKHQAAVKVGAENGWQHSLESPAWPDQRPDPIPGLPLELGPWKATHQHWFSGASKMRWSFTYALYA